ncbi:hypothetical protein V8C37DRAFT_370573 [Trichoderma ceciliae]
MSNGGFPLYRLYLRGNCLEIRGGCYVSHEKSLSSAILLYFYFLFFCVSMFLCFFLFLFLFRPLQQKGSGGFQVSVTLPAVSFGDSVFLVFFRLDAQTEQSRRQLQTLLHVTSNLVIEKKKNSPLL